MDMLVYAGVSVVVTLFFTSTHLWRCNRNTPIPNWPIVGMLLGVLRNLSNIHDYATAILKHHGGTLMFVGPWLTNTNFVITSDPMNVHHITSKNFGNYGKGSEFHEIFEVLGDEIFYSDFQKWKYHRDLLQSLFKNNNFESFLQHILHKKLESCLLPFLNHASKAGTHVDLQDIFQRFTFDNICSLVLGFDPNCLPNKFSEVAYEKAFNVVEDAILCRHIVPRSLWKLQKWLQIGHGKKFNESQKIVDQFLIECITSKREERSKFSDTKVDESSFDMFNALMEARGMEQIDDKFLRDTAINLLAAGRDTISAGLSWFFWLVSTHPLVEAKILEEIRQNFTTKEENWLASGVKEFDKLVYLHGAICVKH